MKKIPSVLLCCLFLLSCNEKRQCTVLTKVLPNGSCERTMVMEGDSSSYETIEFIIPIDSTWEQDISWKLDTTEDTYTCRVAVTKHYSSINEMNAEFSQTNDSLSSQIATHIHMQKKFRWFYTYYHYSELFLKIYGYDYYPITNYFNQEEISAYLWEETDSLYFAGMDSVAMKAEKDRLEDAESRFLIDNYFEAIRRLLYTVMNTADSSKLADDDISGYLGTKFTADMLFDEQDVFARAFDSIFSPLSFSTLEASLEDDFDKIEASFLPISIGDYKSELLLPGKLINTNANTLRNDTISWHVDNKNTYVDYELWAKSRMVNYWAWIVSALVLVVAMLLFFIPGKK